MATKSFETYLLVVIVLDGFSLLREFSDAFPFLFHHFLTPKHRRTTTKNFFSSSNEISHFLCSGNYLNEFISFYINYLHASCLFVARWFVLLLSDQCIHNRARGKSNSNWQCVKINGKHLLDCLLLYWEIR